MATSGKRGSATQAHERVKRAAARMKMLGIERTHGRCALCYRIIEIDGPKSRYRHLCRL